MLKDLEPKNSELDIEAVSAQLAQFFFDLWQNRRSKMDIKAAPEGSGKTDQGEQL